MSLEWQSQHLKNRGVLGLLALTTASKAVPFCVALNKVKKTEYKTVGQSRLDNLHQWEGLAPFS